MISVNKLWEDRLKMDGRNFAKDKLQRKDDVYNDVN